MSKKYFPVTHLRQNCFFTQLSGLRRLLSQESFAGGEQEVSRVGSAARNREKEI